jgi:hypothetical protein
MRQQLKRSVKREGITMQMMLLEATDEWLQKHPPPPPPDDHPRMF